MNKPPEYTPIEAPPDYNITTRSSMTQTSSTFNGITFQINGIRHTINDLTINHMISKAIDCDNIEYVKLILEHNLIDGYNLMHSMVEYYLNNKYKPINNCDCNGCIKIIHILFKKMIEINKDETIAYAFDLINKEYSPLNLFDDSPVYIPITYLIKEKYITSNNIINDIFKKAVKSRQGEVISYICPYITDIDVINIALYIGTPDDIKKIILDNTKEKLN